MEKQYDKTEEGQPRHVVSEPAGEYGVAARTMRTITDAELARCMTLEESERLITEKIYRFYNQMK